MLVPVSFVLRLIVPAQGKVHAPLADAIDGDAVSDTGSECRLPLRHEPYLGLPYAQRHGDVEALHIFFRVQCPEQFRTVKQFDAPNAVGSVLKTDNSPEAPREVHHKLAVPPQYDDVARRWLT